MSWSAKINVLLLALLLALPACGFTPLYGNGGAAQHEDVRAQLGSIHIASIPNREGQYLRNLLIDRLYSGGRPESPAYTLTIATIQETRTDLDITKSSNATRAQLRLNTHMTLTEQATGRKVLERPLSAITSYNILQSQFTTRVSEQNTRENALEELARQAELQLALYFTR